MVNETQDSSSLNSYIYNFLFKYPILSNVYKTLCVIYVFDIFVLLLKKVKINISYNFQNF